MGEYFNNKKMEIFGKNISQCGIIDIQGGQLVKFVFNESTRYTARYALCTHKKIFDWKKIWIFPQNIRQKSIFFVKIGKLSSHFEKKILTLREKNSFCFYLGLCPQNDPKYQSNYQKIYFSSFSPLKSGIF